MNVRASHLAQPETQGKDGVSRGKTHEVNKREVIQSVDFGSDVAEHEAKDLARYFVETDQWYRIFGGQVDVIYGAKGSGKSAIYHLMMNKEGEFFDRDILLVPAENPDEDPAFMEIRSDLPPTEEEFTGFWKLYFCSVAAVRARDAGVSNGKLREVLDQLAGLHLIDKHVSLNTIIRNISDYVARVFRPSSVSATTHFDPSSGVVTGVTGKVSFSEPTADARTAGVRPIRELLSTLNEALKTSGQTIWLLLDRLDVAFAGNDEVETRALRALFGAYKDMSGLDRVRLKLFIRTDIWDRIIESGFREATHASSPTKSIILRWDNTLLFNLFLKRLLQSDRLCQEYAIDKTAILTDSIQQEALINRVFPDKIDTGKNPKTFDWVCGRLEDGKNETMPRELIQFCSGLRAEQLQRLEKAAAPLPGELLFERASFKAALPPISTNRLLIPTAPDNDSGGFPRDACSESIMSWADSRPGGINGSGDPAYQSGSQLDRVASAGREGQGRSDCSSTPGDCIAAGRHVSQRRSPAEWDGPSDFVRLGASL